MAVITKFRAVLTGFTGAPGVNTFYALNLQELEPIQSDIDDFANQLQSMYENLAFWLVGTMSVDIDPVVDSFDVATGELVKRSQISQALEVPGDGLQNDVSRATQAKFRYQTDRIRRNRFVQGGIFFGPLSSGAIDQDGSLDTQFQGQVPNAHEGLLDVAGPMRLAIWSQPSPGGSDGEYGYVQSVSVSNKPAVLRSRRD